MRHRRPKDWHNDLQAAVREFEDKPFSWGENDCCIFAAHCVERMIGADLMEGHRDYMGEREALAKMRESGGFDELVAGQAAKHGLTEIKPAFAQRGDLVLMHHNARQNCGIVWFDGSVVCLGNNGLVFLPISDAIRAWRVS